MNSTLFQYCQKMVVFNEDGDAVLLARRKGEADYDGIFSFIGGKLETTDAGLLEGLKREKNEEIGVTAKLRIYPKASYNEYYTKKSGQAMVLPHYYAVYQGGGITLNEEYSEYSWVPLSELETFEPKIDTVPGMVDKILNLKNIVNQKDMVEI